MTFFFIQMIISLKDNTQQRIFYGKRKKNTINKIKRDIEFITINWCDSIISIIYGIEMFFLR